MKTNAEYQQSAQRGDEEMAANVSKGSHPMNKAYHEQGRCIVWGSHALMKLCYWDEEGSRHPDPMHTISNEVRAGRRQADIMMAVAACKVYYDGNVSHELATSHHHNVMLAQPAVDVQCQIASAHHKAHLRPL